MTVFLVLKRTFRNLLLDESFKRCRSFEEPHEKHIDLSNHSKRVANGLNFRRLINGQIQTLLRPNGKIKLATKRCMIANSFIAVLLFGHSVFMFTTAAIATLYLLYRALKIGLNAVDGIY
ncbi:hypothetical protein T11_16274 [Trichinella zimbabwensis]|uniref:Uncharacterized protein n=1 Tax=Trichinella zimbabwensis TaxID=268475 RepID=A0A0V1HRJ9_9BILA|nr:hypothetical protein T11_16274 [Trichinella zimbabwensis]